MRSLTPHNGKRSALAFNYNLPPKSGELHHATAYLTRPDDWHLHLRDGALMQSVLPRPCAIGRAIDAESQAAGHHDQPAQAYRTRILAALPANSRFRPLMTLYLTDNTTEGNPARCCKWRYTR
jgi:dihydroorotase